MFHEQKKAHSGEGGKWTHYFCYVQTLMKPVTPQEEFTSLKSIGIDDSLGFFKRQMGRSLICPLKSAKMRTAFPSILSSLGLFRKRYTFIRVCTSK